MCWRQSDCQTSLSDQKRLMPRVSEADELERLHVFATSTANEETRFSSSAL